MSLHRGRSRGTIRHKSITAQSLIKLFTIYLSNDKRTALEFLAGKLEGLFAYSESRAFEAVSQRDERALSRRIQYEERAIALDRARRRYCSFNSAHWYIQHLCIRYAHGADIEELAESPAGIVIGSLGIT